MKKGFIVETAKDNAHQLIRGIIKWDSATGKKSFDEAVLALRNDKFIFFSPFGEERGKNINKAFKFLHKTMGGNVGLRVGFDNFTRLEKVKGFMLDSVQDVGWAECMVPEFFSIKEIGEIAEILGVRVVQANNNIDEEFPVSIYTEDIPYKDAI